MRLGARKSNASFEFSLPKPCSFVGAFDVAGAGIFDLSLADEPCTNLIEASSRTVNLQSWNGP